MLTKVLGAVDLITALFLFLMAIKLTLPVQLTIVLIIVLAVKSLPFLLSFCIGSLIDVGIAAVLVLSLFLAIPVLIYLIAALLIAQKGIFSLL